MKSLADAKLVNACKVFAVANTPLFLVRKLRSDQEVIDIGQTISGDEILEGIRSALQKDYSELLSAVRPYAYLVALFMKPDSKWLREAEKVDSSGWGWYSDIAKYLLESHSPILIQTIKTPIQKHGTISVHSSIPTGRSKLFAS